MRTKYDERPLFPCNMSRAPIDAPYIRSDSVTLTP